MYVSNMEELHTALSIGGAVVEWKDFQTALSVQHSQESSSDQSRQCCSASLENEELWQKFHSITNEMIVTRAGRRMFPSLQVFLSSLDPSLSYSVLLQFQSTHPHRWRFLNGEWQAGSTITDSPDQQPALYVHPSSPASGADWMKEVVSFAKLKLSNKEKGNGKVKLNSLHRYQPCVHVVQLSSLLEGQPLISSHTFKPTQFIAVTAYQNEKITQMKIKHNPFAKAFLTSHDSKTDDKPLMAAAHMIPSLTTPPPVLSHAPPYPQYPGGASPMATGPLSHYSIPPYYHDPTPVHLGQEFRTTNYAPNVAHGQSLTHNLI